MLPLCVSLAKVYVRVSLGREGSMHTRLMTVAWAISFLTSIPPGVEYLSMRLSGERWACLGADGWGAAIDWPSAVSHLKATCLRLQDIVVSMHAENPDDPRFQNQWTAEEWASSGWSIKSRYSDLLGLTFVPPVLSFC